MVKQRNYGLDFLRIFSMALIVLAHVLGQGGILDSAVPGSVNYWVAWFMESSIFCSVNCFALISGYFLSVKKAKFSSLASLWLQTIFYSVSLTLIFYFFYPETSMNKFEILFSFMPVMTKRYWYISAYIGMCILSPLLNVVVANAQKRILELSFIAILFVYCGFSLIFDPFHLGQGNSTIWLCLIYIMGGYFRKYDVASKVKKYKGWLLFASMTVLAVLFKYIVETFTILPEKFEESQNCLMNVNSPTILLASVGLFIATVQMNVPKPFRKIVSVLASASLGVYLIHVAKPVWQDVFEGFSKDFVNYNPVVMVLMVLGSTVLIYLGCSVIELVRQGLFRLLRIDALILKLEGFCKKWFDEISCKLNNKEKQG